MAFNCSHSPAASLGTWWHFDVLIRDICPPPPCGCQVNSGTRTRENSRLCHVSLQFRVPSPNREALEERHVL